MSTKTLVSTTLAIAISAGLYSHFRQVHVLQSEIAALSQKNARMAAQYNQERKRLLSAEKDLEGNRTAQQLLQSAQAENRTGSEYLAKMNLLKNYLDRFPQANIPELTLLQPVDWLKVATDFPLNNEMEVRKAVAELRLSAKKRLGPQLANALKAYVSANNQILPTDPGELAPYSTPPIAPEILARYKMIITGDANNAMQGGTLKPVLAERDRVDDTYDSELHISPLGSWGWTSTDAKPSEFQAQLQLAGKRWQEAHPGQNHPSDRAEVRAYIDPSVDQDQLEHWIKTGRPTRD